MSLSWEAWLTLAVLALCIGLLASNRYPPDAILGGGLAVLLLSGVIGPEQALAGLSNPGMVTVAVLYLVVGGMRETGGIVWLSQAMLGRPRSLTSAQLRLMLPVAGLSAFLNNTPVVAMFIPAVQDWGKRYALPLSKLMIPLSFASIAGGTCTVIGTSTNLVIDGLLRTETTLPGFSLFELAWIGVPILLVVSATVLLAGRWLLPERRSAISRFADARKYTVEMLVEAGNGLVGKTVEEAGLRQLPGMYLVEVDREGTVLPAVSPHERLKGGDRLVFAGIVESVVDLRKIRGLTPATDQVFKLDSPRHERCLIEAVVSDSHPLTGKTIREGRFRTLYSAAVIAVARNGERIDRKIGDIVLRAGDTLLLETHHSFIEQHRNSRDFLLVSRLDDSNPPRHERAGLAISIVAGMVGVVTLGWLSMLEAAILAAALMLLTRCTSTRSARRTVDWQVLVVIAASFGIGNALLSSSAAEVLARGLIASTQGNPLASQALIFVLTALFTALVTNNAAAVLMFPIALSASEELGVSFMPFAVTIMVAASASFATPIGYQTNLMVYGPGGYKFADYLRIGVPLTAVVGITTVAVVPMVWVF
jgi:di/tricarboxylate transporter